MLHHRNVELRDALGYRTILEGTSAVGFSWHAGRTLTLRWQTLADVLVDVRLTVTAEADRPITRWRLKVVNRSARQRVGTQGAQRRSRSVSLIMGASKLSVPSRAGTSGAAVPSHRMLAGSFMGRETSP